MDCPDANNAASEPELLAIKQRFPAVAYPEINKLVDEVEMSRARIAELEREVGELGRCKEELEERLLDTFLEDIDPSGEEE